MKKLSSILFVSLLSGILTLGGYLLLIKLDWIPNPNTTSSFTPTIPSPRASYNLTNMDFTEAAENTVHAVVHVKNVSYRNTPSNALLEYFYGYRGTQKQAEVGTGSGVIISEDGYIVTNNHVIANATELEVTLNNNESYKAKLIGTDVDMDIALLKINTPYKLSYLVFGDSDGLQLGEWVLAVGNPYNLTSTVTAGIISAKARNLSKSGIQSFIQTDAVVNPGNSGGALVNSRGELIGINTMISSTTGSYMGYSFAVPSNVTRKIIEDLLEFGNVQQGVLGIQGIELNRMIAQELGLKLNQGFYIQSTTQHSDAEKTGLQQGDIITAINNRPIHTFVDIKSVLNTKRPQDVVEVEVWRSNQRIVKQVALIKPEQAEFNFNGLELENLSNAVLKDLQLDYGVRIKKITNSNLLVYKKELEGAILLTINGNPINDIQTANTLLKYNTGNSRFRLELLTPHGELIRLLL